MTRQHVAAAALFSSLAVAVTWPLARLLGRAVSDPGDPFVNIWILDWDWWATFHRPLSLFHATAFYPAKYSLAFSENLYGIAVLLFPLRAAGIGAVEAYNVAMIVGFAFSGFGAYLLGWSLSRSFAAAMAAGIFYACVPFRFVHLSHLQHVWGGWIPLLLVALLAYVRRPSWRSASAFAAVLLMNGLTSLHAFFFGTFAIALTAALLVPKGERRRLLLASFAGLALLAPFLVPYAAAGSLYGLVRTWGEMAAYSARPSHWLPHEGNPELRLFPGWLPLALAGLALLRFRTAGAQIALAAIWVAIGFFGSLGANFEFHRFLFGAVPGFQSIRVPARWAVIAYVGMAILIAVATAMVGRRNRWLGGAVPLALAVALWPSPVRWYLAPPPSPVDRWLAQHSRGPIVELPIEPRLDYGAMLRATTHRQPFVNPGFLPPPLTPIAAQWKETPIPDAFVDTLRASGIRIIVLHASGLPRETAVKEWLRRELDRGRITFLRSFDGLTEGDWLFEIGGGRREPEQQIEAFLRGETRCPDATIGALAFPPAEFAFDHGGAMFSGWVVSRRPIAEVVLWFDNRSVRHVPTLQRGRRMSDHCAGDPAAYAAVFVSVLPHRPSAVGKRTDVEVEVVDDRGDATPLGYRWFTWGGDAEIEK